MIVELRHCDTTLLRQRNLDYAEKSDYAFGFQTVRGIRWKIYRIFRHLLPAFLVYGGFFDGD